MDKNKKVILIVNRDKPECVSVGRQLCEWLASYVTVVADNLKNKLQMDTLPLADTIVVVGGDGTILATVRELGSRQVPIIGVNMGKLGFLAEFSVEQFKEMFGQVVNHCKDEKFYTSRMMLSCCISSPYREDFVSTVVNEVAVIAGPPFRMIEVAVTIGDEELALCSGDGLIVATPTGSTAYNLSAGGPILASTIDSAVITPLAAHSLSFRPIVVDLDKPITLYCRDCHENQAKQQVQDNTAVIVIDGQIHMPLKGVDKVVISKSETRFMLAQNPHQSQWQLLSAKLHWGHRPRYENIS